MVLVLCAAASVAHAAPVVPELPTIDAAVVPPGRGRATEPSVGAIGDVVAIAFSEVDDWGGWMRFDATCKTLQHRSGERWRHPIPSLRSIPVLPNWNA